MAERKKGATPTERPPRTRAARTTQKTEKKEPKWVEPFLELVAAGLTARFAAHGVNVSDRTARQWFEKSEERRRRLTRAREQRASDATDRLTAACWLAAEKYGSSWHMARLWALFDPETWKRINETLKQCDPDRVSVDVTGDGRPAVTLDQLYRLSQNGGFAHEDGDGDTTAKD